MPLNKYYDSLENQSLKVKQLKISYGIERYNCRDYLADLPSLDGKLCLLYLTIPKPIGIRLAKNQASSGPVLGKTGGTVIVEVPITCGAGPGPPVPLSVEGDELSAGAGVGVGDGEATGATSSKIVRIISGEGEGLGLGFGVYVGFGE